METIFSRDKDFLISYIAFFDLDRTIISSNSGKSLVRYAYSTGLMNITDLIRGGVYSLLYKLNLRETTRIITSMVRWVKGLPESKMKKLSADIFNNRIRYTIHSEVEAEINFHKKNGALVVILSSSISEICNKVAEYLGMDDVICSNLEISDGVYTGRPEGPLCFGEEKVTRLMKYCKQINIDPADSWYYGDSITDFPVLSSVGNPVCVNPDRKLNKAAKKSGWKILRWQ